MYKFSVLVFATLCHFTWSEQLKRFVRLFPRADRLGYDVDLVTPEWVIRMNPQLTRQYMVVPLTEETLRRLVALSTGLSDCRSADEAHVRLVLDHDGHAIDMKHERRVIGL